MRYMVYRGTYFGSARRDEPVRWFWFRDNALAYIGNLVPDASLPNPVGRHVWILEDRWTHDEQEVFRW